MWKFIKGRRNGDWVNFRVVRDDDVERKTKVVRISDGRFVSRSVRRKSFGLAWNVAERRFADGGELKACTKAAMKVVVAWIELQEAMGGLRPMPPKPTRKPRPGYGKRRVKSILTKGDSHAE